MATVRTVPVALRLTEATIAQVDARAAAKGQTRAEWLRRVIEAQFDREVTPHPKKRS